MTPDNNLEKNLEELGTAIHSDADFVARVMDKVNTVHTEQTTNKQKKLQRSILMKSLKPLAAAAVIAFAIGAAIFTLDKTTPIASAQEIMAMAVKAVENINTVYIKLNLRSNERENFHFIDPDYGFVPVEMWKEFDGTPFGKWRAQKTGRQLVFDGTESILYLTASNHAAKFQGPAYGMGWVIKLLDVSKIIQNEAKAVENNNWDMTIESVTGTDGLEKNVVTVYAKALGDYSESDYAKNTSLAESDNTRIYTFDAKTKMLESLEIYMQVGQEDIKVLEITEIIYDLPISPSMWTLEIPQDASWRVEPESIGVDYDNMTAKEVATAFFEACSREDWDEAIKFTTSTKLNDVVLKYYGDLEIVSIGEPFKSGITQHQFVPYEIKFSNGSIGKSNLALRNDNPAGRYVIDGGLCGP